MCIRDRPSMVLLEQIQTVNKDDLTEYIGFVDDERLWRQINAALKKTFGLWPVSYTHRDVYKRQDSIRLVFTRYAP